MSAYERIISPDLTVALDESLCIVLRTPERTITVGNVDALKAALDDARTYQQVMDSEAWNLQAARLRAHQQGTA